MDEEATEGRVLTEEETAIFDKIEELLNKQGILQGYLLMLEGAKPEDMANAENEAAQTLARACTLDDEVTEEAEEFASDTSAIFEQWKAEGKTELVRLYASGLGEFYHEGVGIARTLAEHCVAAEKLMKKPTKKLTKKPRRKRVRNTGLTFTKDKLTATIFNTYKDKAPLTPADWANGETVPVDNGKAKSTTKLDISTGKVSETEMERVTSYFLPSQRIWLDMLNSIVHDGATDFTADDILARAGIKKPKRAAKEKREAYETILKLWGSYVAAETTSKDGKEGKFGNYITITPTRMLDADIPVTFAKDKDGKATSEIADFEVHLNLQPGDKPSKALPLLEYAEATQGIVPATGEWFSPHKAVSMDWRRIANHLYRHAASDVKHPDRCTVETVMGATGITPWSPKPSTAKEKAALRDKRRKTQNNIESVLEHWQSFGGIESWERIEEGGGVTGYRWDGFANAHQKRVVEIDADKAGKRQKPAKS